MKTKESAGLLIIYDNKILLGHPTNSKWYNSYSIPKGGIDEGETPLDAAIRETKEEVGITVPKNLIDKKQMSIVYKTSSYKKTLYYFIVKINDLKQLGLSDLKIPKSDLQLKEIDWAGFIGYKEAMKRVSKHQRELVTQNIFESLDLINNKNKKFQMDDVMKFSEFINEGKSVENSEKKALVSLRKDLEKMVNKYSDSLNDSELGRLSDFIVSISKKIKNK